MITCYTNCHHSSNISRNTENIIGFVWTNLLKDAVEMQITSNDGPAGYLKTKLVHILVHTKQCFAYESDKINWLDTYTLNKIF